jgi:hypothetical protein
MTICWEGCLDRQAWKQSFRSQIPAEDDSLARHYINLIQSRQYEAAIEKLDPRIRTADINEKLKQISAFLDRGIPISVEPVSYNQSPDHSQITLQYQIEYQNAWVLATIVVKKHGADRLISISRFNPLYDSVERLNSFIFFNKGLRHYIFIIPMTAAFLFITYTIILCLRTKEIRYKWLWIIIILVVVGKFSLNWTTGDYSFQALNIKIGIPPGFDASKLGSPYAPWILSFSFPLGAVFFLLARKRLRTHIATTDEIQQVNLLAKNEVLPREIQCPDCGVDLELNEAERTGKKFKCSVCNETFVIKD